MGRQSDFKKHPRTRFAAVADLSRSEARAEVEALREGISFHDHKYYVDNHPVIADAVYDRLLRRLQELENAFPEWQSDNSPTRRVGGKPLDRLKRVRHTAPLLSLHAALDEGEFAEFHAFVRREAGRNRVRYVVEPKFDGVSVEVVYQDGRFQFGATRGDGRTGEDVSANLRTIGSVPLSLRGDGRPPRLLAARGEVYLPRDGFQRMNRDRVERGDEPYANARNATAGILRRLESRVVARYPLDIFFYDIVKVEGVQFDTHWDELQQFPKWGLKTDPHVRRCSSRKEVAEYHRKMEDERDSLPYEIDGIVVKVDDKRVWEKLGTRHRSPRGAMAWKFRPREEVTTLADIVVQVGRTGKLTPVALLQPVNVGDVTVSRATLHNAGEVHRKDVRPGDTVRVARAGDVIPEVVERVKQPGKRRAKPFHMPRKCPVCGTTTVREGACHFCPADLSCPPQVVGRIVHYGSREALDIDALGEQTARELVNKGLVNSLADLYELTEDDLLQLERFAEKSAKKLHRAIQQTSRPRLDRFLYALGIRHVGSQVARVLARKFRSLDAVRRASEAELAGLKDVGPVIARSVRTFFDEPRNKDVLNRLERLGVAVRPMPSSETDKQNLSGKTFVFTGELENYTRAAAKRAVERLGGRATSSVSGETDYLVAGSNPGGKLDDARQRGVQVLDEKRFQKLLSR